MLFTKSIMLAEISWIEKAEKTKDGPSSKRKVFAVLPCSASVHIDMPLLSWSEHHV